MITLLTDFGTADYFVPAVKGVILTLNPDAKILDLTHEIAAQDVESAAFTLGACYRNFPAGTIHVAIVDPGVGSSRRAIIVEAGQQLFVGPDNGIFSFVYARESGVRVFHITRNDLFRQPLSPTFHGRDMFAPIAAHLSRDIRPEAFGPEIPDYIRFDIGHPCEIGQGKFAGNLIHIDRFGNCITNFTEREIRLEQVGQSTKMRLTGLEITQFGTHFAEATRKNELFAYPGSAGYWEIGLWCASAAELTGAKRGAEVVLEVG